MDPSANEPVSKPESQPPAAKEPSSSPLTTASEVGADAEPRSGWGQRELTMVAAALIGSGAITLIMLSASGTSTSAAPGPPVTRARAAAPSADAASSSTSGWTENSKVWTGGARKSIAFELASRNETSVWMKTVRPLIVVRCIKGRTDAFVYTDSPAAMEPQDEDHTVRLGFDGREPRIERWPDSTEHDALFAPDSRAFVAQLEQAQTFKFGYTPHNASPVVAQFDVAGLSQRLARSGCGQ